jgi:hypothetical protein
MGGSCAETNDSQMHEPQGTFVQKLWDGSRVA